MAVRIARRKLAQTLAAASALTYLPAGRAQPDQKVLRYAFPVAETGFDPAQLSDLYSRTVTAHIFDSLIIYDYLARPAKIKPLVAEAMPEVSSDFRVYTFRVRRGILFHDDPVFKGQPRELTAQDFVYAIKRFYDPRWKSPIIATLEEFQLLGLSELRQSCIKNRTQFPYDVEVDGLRALDRYTLRIRLAENAPTFIEVLAEPDLFGAVAREVVEAYGDDIMAHPVGTGPFRLAHWARSSKIVLERHPKYRKDVFDAEPEANDAPAQAAAERLRGARLPLLDRVEISIIDEPQPRWLAFLNGEHDFLERMPNDFINQAAPGGRIAPGLARRGLQMLRTLAADVYYTVFNMKDPVVGGYTPEKIALRRAISLGLNIDEEIRIPRRGQAIVAQAPLNPYTFGYDPDLHTEMGVFDLARARALLDLFGYVDRDGDGWRELPDGTPLSIEFRTTPDQEARQLDEIRKKNMDVLGIKLEFKFAKWPEHLKAARAAKFMMWRVGSLAASYDSKSALQRAYGPAAGGQNLAHFEHAEFDRLYDGIRVEPYGPRRLQLTREAIRIWLAYMPYKTHVHRIVTDLMQPGVANYVRQPFQIRFWEFIDVDAALQTRA